MEADQNESTSARNKALAERRFGDLAKKKGLRGDVLDAHQQGRENLNRVLVWTWAWGWTTELALQRLLDVQRRPGSAYVNKGVLERHPAPMSKTVAYLLAPMHQSTAQILFEDSKPGAPVLRYPWPRTAIPWSHFLHHEKSQLIALAEMRRRPGCVLTTAREITGRAMATPDFILGYTDRTEWHEVELNGKYDEKLTNQLYQREIARRRGEFTHIIWHCLTETMAINIKTELSKPVRPATMKRGDGRIVIDHSKGGWDPAPLLAASEFLVIGDDRDRPREIKAKLEAQKSLDLNRFGGDVIGVIDGL